MKVLEYLDRRIETVYQAEDAEFTSVARILLLVNVLLSVVALAMAFIITATGPQRYIMAGLFAVLLSLAALVLYGRAILASLLTSTILSIILSAIVFLNADYENFFEYYMIGFFNLFAMGLTILIAYRSWQVFFIAATTIIAVILNTVFRALPYSRASGKPMEYDDPLIVIVLTFLVATSLYAVMRRTRRFLSMTVAAGAQSDRQLGILRGAMGASTEALAQGGKLTESASRTSALAAESGEFIAQAERSMRELSGDSVRLGEEINLIGRSSAQARSSAESQSSVINETSAAIEQMTASIRSINAVTRERQGAVRELSKSTVDGREIVAASSRSMEAVESSTGAILDIVKVISAVAAQTNLLAMNAAIEAAHAGDAGRGFAVVADEIRKLSEQTSKSVKAVTDTVKGTINDIRKAGEGNDKAVASFSTIAREAELVSGAMQEIIDGLDELSKGTDEINRGVSDSVTSTNELRGAVAELDAQISKARESLSALEIAAGKVETDLGKVHDTIGSISVEARKVQEVGVSNAEGLASLKAALDRAGL